mgnify:CR=1 FL=1
MSEINKTEIVAKFQRSAGDTGSTEVQVALLTARINGLTEHFRVHIKNEFQRHDRDTGSSEVQIAILTKEIAALTEHLKANKKDHSSRYGLLRKVQNRRKLLDYLKRTDLPAYRKLIDALNLRK